MQNKNILGFSLPQRSLGLRVAALFFLFSVSWASTDKSERSGRIFSLFNVVRFKNGMCTFSANDGSGTCMTASDCVRDGGRARGNCAAGFGVCCGFTINACGGEVRKNCTYVENRGYPIGDATMATCKYVFRRIQNNICSMRLDFMDVAINVAAPAMASLMAMAAVPPAMGGAPPAMAAVPTVVPTAGNCLDRITVRSSTSSIRANYPPVVCGQLTGQHMYIDTEPLGTQVGELDVLMGSLLPTKFRIKVSYIECNSRTKPPQGCLQYHTGMVGSIQSFNHAGGQLLEAQLYSICIRQEEGMCSISYSESAQLVPDPFFLSNSPFTNTMCQNRNHLTILSHGSSALQAPNSPLVMAVPPSMGVYNIRENFQSTRCGTIFSNADKSTIPGEVQGLRGVPFVVGVRTVLSTDVQVAMMPAMMTGMMMAGMPAAMMEVTINQLDKKTGFNLDYRQLPC